MRTRSQLVCLVALLPVIAAADSVRAHFLVGAIVEPHLTLTTLAAPERVQVTRADLARGYVDVAATYRIANNDRRGYLLHFDTRTGLTRAIEVKGLAAPLTLGDLGADVHQQDAVGAREYALRYRLHLAPGAREGSYELPVRLDARAL